MEVLRAKTYQAWKPRKVLQSLWTPSCRELHAKQFRWCVRRFFTCCLSLTLKSRPPHNKQQHVFVCYEIYFTSTARSCAPYKCVSYLYLVILLIKILLLSSYCKIFDIIVFVLIFVLEHSLFMYHRFLSDIYKKELFRTNRLFINTVFCMLHSNV